MPPKFPLQPRRFAGKSRVQNAQNAVLWLQAGALIFLTRPFFWCAFGFFILFLFYFSFYLFYFYSSFFFFIILIVLPNCWHFYLNIAFSISHHQKINIKKSFDFLLFLLTNLFSIFSFFIFYFLSFLENKTFNQILVNFILYFFVFLFIFILFFLLFSFSALLIKNQKTEIFHAFYYSFLAILNNYRAFLILFLFFLMLFFIGILSAGLALIVIIPILAGTFSTAYEDIFEGI